MAPKSFGRAHLSRTIKVNSIQKGLIGGSSFWMAMFGARFLLRNVQKVTKSGEKPIRFSEELKPGESLVIKHLDPTRRGH